MDDSGSATGSSLVPARPRHLLTAVWVLCGLVVLLDQVTKALALRYLSESEAVTVVGELLRLRLVFNPGAAFSIGTGMTWVLTLVAVLVVAVVVRVSQRLGSRGWAVALGLLLGGALGNLGDRLLRPPGFARGHVVDFLELPNWPVFNIADSAISTAAVLIVVLGLRGIAVDGSRERDAREPAGA
jgi:signal peptidase II